MYNTNINMKGGFTIKNAILYSNNSMSNSCDFVVDC